MTLYEEPSIFNSSHSCQIYKSDINNCAKIVFNKIIFCITEEQSITSTAVIAHTLFCIYSIFLILIHLILFFHSVFYIYISNLFIVQLF